MNRYPYTEGDIVSFVYHDEGNAMMAKGLLIA
jgi:hypothetical protein